MCTEIFVQVRDPSGEVRVLQFKEGPVILGTHYSGDQSLRDSRLAPDALLLEYKNGWILKCRHNELLVEVGDLKFPAIQVPFEVPLQIADTELIFFEYDPRKAPLVTAALKSKWYTRSPSGVKMLADLKKASLTRLSVYLHGQTGTGKEILAEQVHAWSVRAGGAFVAINCGALPLSLAESELFGHVKGAFTGATRDRVGAFLQAHNGTLFLDEVGDLPVELQVKLLRFLECGEIRPVGSDRVLHADVRVVCATHKPLRKLVDEGKFREDLYFRLASISIEVPCLNSRPEDIKALANRYAKESGKKISEKGIVRLLSHHWAGNVRELRHAMERACGSAGPAESILTENSFDFLHQHQGGPLPEQLIQGICTLEEMERMLLLRALKMANGNRTNAAKLLGIARSTLFDMIRRYQIIGPKLADYRIAEKAV